MGGHLVTHFFGLVGIGGMFFGDFSWKASSSFLLSRLCFFGFHEKFSGCGPVER